MKTSNPTPKLRAGLIYIGDNGQRICLECAGASAKFTAHDISGRRVRLFTASDASEWQEMTGKPLACEAGCTSFNRAQ